MSITRRDFLRLSAYGFGTAFLAACGFRPGDNPPPINPTELPALSPTVISQALTELGFEAFADQVKVYQDAQYLYVESNGMPAHPMMIGIKSWQQQVPLPQPFTGSNAWKIPLHPVVAENPISAKTDLYRGAIALAVNGVPIFNALNNRGDDAYLYGELDEFGGHAAAPTIITITPPHCIFPNLSASTNPSPTPSMASPFTASPNPMARPSPTSMNSTVTSRQTAVITITARRAIPTSMAACAELSPSAMTRSNPNRT
jgi:hypothetical protein